MLFSPSPHWFVYYPLRGCPPPRRKFWSFLQISGFPLLCSAWFEEPESCFLRDSLFFLCFMVMLFFPTYELLDFSKAQGPPELREVQWIVPPFPVFSPRVFLLTHVFLLPFPLRRRVNFLMVPLVLHFLSSLLPTRSRPDRCSPATSAARLHPSSFASCCCRAHPLFLTRPDRGPSESPAACCFFLLFFLAQCPIRAPS